MSNPSKQKGTRAETAVVRYLDFHELRSHRNTLAGAYDKGDISAEMKGLDVCIEVKNRKRIELAKWMGEVASERVNSKADVGMLVMKPEGIGTERVGKWWVCMTMDELMWLVGV